MRKLLTKISAYARVLPTAMRNRLDLIRFLVRRPALLVAVGGYEAAVLVSSRVDNRIKALAVGTHRGVWPCRSGGRRLARSWRLHPLIRASTGQPQLTRLTPRADAVRSCPRHRPVARAASTAEGPSASPPRA